MQSRLPWILLALSYFHFHLVNANTEIINFDASVSLSSPVPASSEWPILDSINYEREFLVAPAPLDTPLESICAGTFPCEHELWIALDTGDGQWMSYKRFTLRLSWPASYPADFSIELVDLTANATTPSASSTSILSEVLDTQLRRHQYARIRVVTTGVRTPSPHSDTANWTTSPPAVPFMLILEPLLLGFIPQSILPVLCVLVPTILIVCLALPRILKHLERIAQRIRDDMAGNAKDRKD